MHKKTILMKSKHLIFFICLAIFCNSCEINDPLEESETEHEQQQNEETQDELFGDIMIYDCSCTLIIAGTPIYNCHADGTVTSDRVELLKEGVLVATGFVELDAGVSNNDDCGEDGAMTVTGLPEGTYDIKVYCGNSDTLIQTTNISVSAGNCRKKHLF